jgi:glycosyltransferase involved in cell wall biosynthesis
MMKLLYTSDSPTLSGAEKVLLQYVDHFHQRGHEVHVYLRAGNRRLEAAVQALGVGTTATGGFSNRVLKTTANPFSLGEFAKSFRRVRKELRGLVREGGFDLVHSISYPTSLYCSVALAGLGVPQVWQEHNIKRPHLLNRFLYKFASSTCTAVIGPTDAVTGNLRRFGIARHRLRTLHYGIDTLEFAYDETRAATVRAELGLTREHLAVGLFGQFLPYKGHETLLSAIVKLRSDLPQVRVFFVGALENPPYEEELRNRIAREGLGDIVCFTGWRSDVADVEGAMDVVVVPTLTPEPSALAILESMTMERPVVASRTGGSPELIDHGQNGLLFPPGDADELAGALRLLLRDSDARRRMGRAARQKIERQFELTAHMDEVERLYARSIAGHPLA